MEEDVEDWEADLSPGAQYSLSGGRARPDSKPEAVSGPCSSPLKGNWDSDPNLILPELYSELGDFGSRLLEVRGRVL